MCIQCTFSSHFLNRIFYKIAAQGLVVSVTFCYRTEEVRSAVNYIHLTVLLYFIDVVFNAHFYYYADIHIMNASHCLVVK